MTESSTLDQISKLEGILNSLDKGNPAYQTVEQQLTQLRLSLPQESPSSSESTTDTFFQAIGVLKAKFILETVLNEQGEERQLISLETQGQRFKTIFKGNFRQALLNARNHPDTEFFVLVYPKLAFKPPQIKQPPELKFTVVAWSTEPHHRYRPNEFVLRGFWTFIPQNRTPVFQINRNFLEKETRDKLLAQGQDFKSIYVPVLWRDGVKPFRFNPKADTQPDRFFCQIKAKFLPNRQCFGFQELLAEPTTDSPRYLLSTAKMERLNQKRQGKKERVSTSV